MQKNIIILLLLMTVLVYAEDPVVENVRFEQRTDGTLLVDIYYDVRDAEGDTLEIKIKASADGGLTWDLPCVSLSGDTGKCVMPGTNKHIVWDFYADNPGVSGDSYRIRVIADDNEVITVTDIDGNVYKTVEIGNRWWMAENLKVIHYRNGDLIPYEFNNEEWIMLTIGAYCYYDNDSSHAEDYGAMYNWYAISDSRNIAPEGWHVPTDEEWKELEMALGMSEVDADTTNWRGTNEGGKLKETGTSFWNSPNEGASNESGFTARPGGYRYRNGEFRNLGSTATFWSLTEYADNTTWYRLLASVSEKVFRSNSTKDYGFSVRCVKDNISQVNK